MVAADKIIIVNQAYKIELEAGGATPVIMDQDTADDAATIIAKQGVMI